MAPVLPPVVNTSPRSLVQREHDAQRRELQPLYPARYRPLPLDQRQAAAEPSRRLMPSSVVRDAGMATYCGEMLGQGPQRSARATDSPWWWPETLVWRAPAPPALVVPQDWEERWSQTRQRSYWVETSTRETTWKRPVEAPSLPVLGEAGAVVDTDETLTPRQPASARTTIMPPRTPRTPRSPSADGAQRDLGDLAHQSPFKLLAAVTGPGRAALSLPLQRGGNARGWALEWIDEWVTKATRLEGTVGAERVPAPLCETQQGQPEQPSESASDAGPVSEKLALEPDSGA